MGQFKKCPSPQQDSNLWQKFPKLQINSLYLQHMYDTLGIANPSS